MSLRKLKPIEERDPQAAAVLAAFDNLDREMMLPNGKQCGQCAHHRRCALLFGCPPTNTRCDWSPSHFCLALSEVLV